MEKTREPERKPGITKGDFTMFRNYVHSILTNRPFQPMFEADQGSGGGDQGSGDQGSGDQGSGSGDQGDKAIKAATVEAEVETTTIIRTTTTTTKKIPSHFPRSNKISSTI